MFNLFVAGGEYDDRWEALVGAYSTIEEATHWQNVLNQRISDGLTSGELDSYMDASRTFIVKAPEYTPEDFPLTGEAHYLSRDEMNFVNLAE